MGNRYFVQYLLNVGALKADEVQELMAKASKAEPGLPLLAMRKGLLSSAQLSEMNISDEAAFAEEAKDRKLLTVAQIDTLKNEAASSDACFGQALLDAGLADYAKLEALFSEADEAEEEESPVYAAVMSRAGDDDAHLYEIYGKYADMFISSVQRFMNTDAVLLPGEAMLDADGTHLVSQSLGGGLVLTPGVMAKNDVFLEMGRRYSGEELEEIDNLAVDCVAEFINVLNGLYIVNLSQLDMDVDLGEPKDAENVLPMATNMLALNVGTEFGSFVLYMAQDEFMF